MPATRSVIIDGIMYANVSVAARALGIHRATLSSRLAASRRSCDASSVPTNAPKPALVVNGIAFASVNAAARHFGINVQTFASRVKAGWKGKRLISQASHQNRAKPAVINGKAYSSVKHMVGSHNVCQSSYHRLKALGLSTQESIEVLIHKQCAIQEKARAQKKVA